MTDANSAQNSLDMENPISPNVLMNIPKGSKKGVGLLSAKTPNTGCITEDVMFNIKAINPIWA